MLIKKPDDVRPHEITPESAYVSRRAVMGGAVLAASTVATAGLYRALNPPPKLDVKETC